MKALGRATAVLAGVATGLVLLEGAFRLRDRGAFPHLNIYRPDAHLGVRLQPGSREKISFSDNPVSKVRVNAQGYRGADWPAHADGEILVVGDSQAFGLGVDEADAFAWRLGELLHRPVANAAVPTYGPSEYNLVLAEELPRRRPRTVVYVVNLANDLFESVHPNVTRHAVWDGWAVRRETAPRGIHHFPGRRLLFTYSHAFFALRGLWWRWTGVTTSGAVPSEGGWQDLVGLERAGHQRQLDAGRDNAARDGARREAISRLQAAEVDLTPHISGELLAVTEASPGDIIQRQTGEGAEPMPLTAEAIARAAAARHAIEATLRARRDGATLARLAEHDRWAATLRGLGAGPDSERRSPLDPHLARAKALCDAYGAELVVLVLPLDVQVSAAEWAKYGASKVDLSSSRILAWDVIEAARALGARAVDAWPVLAAAEPGAFLKGDLHMSPKGHARVADALAKLLRTPPRVAPALPEGRSAVPTPAEWTSAPDELPLYRPTEQHAPSLESLGCRGRQVREWARIDCAGGAFELDYSGEPGPLRERQGADVLALDHGGVGTLIFAALPGRFWLGHFVSPRREISARYAWSVHESPRFSFEPHDIGPSYRPPVPVITAGELKLCACEREVTSAAQCTELYGSAEPGCLRAYGDDCESLLACARADRQAPPTCLPDEAMSPTTLRCFARPPR